MKKMVATAGPLALFVLTGLLWICLAEWIPADIPYARPIGVIVVCLLFVNVFIWLLTTRIKRLFIYPGSWYREMLFAVSNLGLLLLAFAYVFHVIGIMDASGPDSPRMEHNYGVCLYFSTINFTTVGYGDYRPVGVTARTLAGIQGLLGYIVLALIASAVTTVIQGQAQDRKEQMEE